MAPSYPTGSYKEASDQLYKIAEHQGGLFTAKQAISAGFDERNHPYHIKKGNWIREMRGIYRLKNFPYYDESQYVLWALWSRNKEGEPQGVFSHYTALSHYDLSDAMPANLYMTVPKSFQRRSEIPKNLSLIKNDLPKHHIQVTGAYRLTYPLRTIYDLLESGMEHPESDIIIQSLDQGWQRGFINDRDFKNTKSYPNQDIVQYIFQLFKEIKKA